MSQELVMSAWKRDCGQTGSTHPHMFWCLVYTQALSHQNVKKKTTTILCPPPHKHHVKIPNCMINHGWARLDHMKSFLKQQLIFAIDADANAALSGLKMMHLGDLSKWWSWRKMLFCLSRSWQVSILRFGVFFFDRSRASFGYLWNSRRNRGERGIFEMTRNGTDWTYSEGNLQISLRWGFWRAFPKWKATTISMNLPSQLSCLPSQAELVRGVGW